MCKFNGKILDPSKLPTMEEVIAGVQALDAHADDRKELMEWSYGEYGHNVAYWHSFDPDDEVGCVLMPVREGMLCVPFGSRFPWEPKGMFSL